MFLLYLRVTHSYSNFILYRKTALFKRSFVSSRNESLAIHGNTSYISLKLVARPLRVFSDVE